MTLDEAKQILCSVLQNNGDLNSGMPWISFDHQDSTVTLDGSFDAYDLEAMAIWMRYQAEQRGEPK